MRTTFYLSFGALLFAVATLSCTSCKSATKTSSDASAETAQSDTLVTAPPFTFATNQDSTISCSFEVDYPRQTDSLAVGVKQFIAKELAQVYTPYNNEEDAAKNYPLFHGDLQKCDALVKHYAEGTKRYFVTQQKEMIEEGTENGWRPNFSCDVKIKKSAETSTYVAYTTSAQVYLGGAHGSYATWETNISKRTYRPLAQTVDTTKVMAMQSILRKGVISYLKDAGCENVEKDYKSMLFLPEDGHIPLPVCTPSLTKDGVSFVYQQYEIASYAVGLVSFTIPYSDIMPYLCDEAKALVGDGSTATGK